MRGTIESPMQGDQEEGIQDQPGERFDYCVIFFSYIRQLPA